MKSRLKCFLILIVLPFVTVSITAQAKLPSAKTDKKTDYLVWGKNYKIIWTEDKYNKDFKTDVPFLVLDQNFIAKAPRYLIALLALPGYELGNECSWNGKYSDKRDNLKCTLNSALGVGYQCSDTQIKLLNKYFPDNNISQKGCSTQPEGSTIGTVLDQVYVMQKNQDTFEVTVKYEIYNTRDNFYKNVTERNLFKLINGHFEQVNVE